jgi:hypothetical protein
MFPLETFERQELRTKMMVAMVGEGAKLLNTTPFG